MILFDNFKKQYSAVKHEVNSAIQRVLDSGWYIMGKELDAFEDEFAKYIGSKFCIGVASGTEAIALSLMAHGIGLNDEVITTNMTAFPTITGIIQSGATPVVVDILLEDGLIDTTKIEGKINKKTKAIVPVHLYGQSVNMTKIIEVAKQYNLLVIEDCAQSAGATYQGIKTGNIGNCGAFSFYPTKNLGAYGDAGAITTNDEYIYKKLLMLRNYGQSKRYYHDEQGINSRLDEIQAAILRIKLKYLDTWNNTRREKAQIYLSYLDVSNCITEHMYGIPIYHLFIYKSNNRDELMKYLKSKDIQCLIHYPVPVNEQMAFQMQRDEEFPVSKNFADSILSLPIYPEILDDEIKYISNTIAEFH